MRRCRCRWVRPLGSSQIRRHLDRPNVHTGIVASEAHESNDFSHIRFTLLRFRSNIYPLGLPEWRDLCKDNLVREQCDTKRYIWRQVVHHIDRGLSAGAMSSLILSVLGRLRSPADEPLVFSP